jgi:hypothetical protein
MSFTRRAAVLAAALTATLAVSFAADTTLHPASARVSPNYPICEETGWKFENYWIGNYYSPWFYATTSVSIQYKVTSGQIWYRITSNCTKIRVLVGSARQFRTRQCDGTCVYTSWHDEAKGCTYKAGYFGGYNIYFNACNYWVAPKPN